MNKLLWGLGIILALCVAAVAVGALLCVVTDLPASSAYGYGACQDELRTIDAAVTMYHIEQGKYPNSPEELVPEYLRVSLPCPENEDGWYYLDTSTSRPRVVCSVNGTLDDFHRPHRKAIEWRYLVLKISIFIAIVGGAVILILFKRKKGQESTWAEYRIPVTMWVGGLLIFVSMLVPMWKYHLGFFWFRSDGWLGPILLAISMFVTCRGLAQFSGEGRKVTIVVGVIMLSFMILWSVVLIVSLEIETNEESFSDIGGALASTGLGLYFLANGALVSLLGFIAALLDTRKKSRETIPATNNPPAAATVCARSR